MTRPIPRMMTVGPGGLDDPGMVVAGSRAGALGVLDAGFRFDAGSCIRTAERVARCLGDRPFGLRAWGEAFEGPAEWLDRLPAGLDVIVVTGIAAGAEGRVLERIRRSGRRAVAEVTTRTGAGAAARAGFEGLILAGHEAGGLGSDDGSFIFLQAIVREPTMPPVWVRGGIGPNAAAACLAAGAAGVVLDGALLLTRESPLDRPARERLARCDGGEPIVVRPRTGASIRVLAAPGSSVLARLREAAEQGDAAWTRAVREEVGWGPGQAWPVGQDVAWAESLARRFVTVGGVVQEVERASGANVRSALTNQPLAEGSPLARGARHDIPDRPRTNDAGQRHRHVCASCRRRRRLAFPGARPDAWAGSGGAPGRDIERPGRAAPGAWASSGSYRRSCAASRSRRSASHAPLSP